MKIVAFNASPSMNGNTSWCVNQILESAREQGAEAELFHTGKLAIKPCQGCLACHREGNSGCVVQDDMQRIYAALEQADALVLASPVYMGQMTAQAKAFTDRLFAQINPRFSPNFKERNAGKKLLLLFTQGNPNPAMFKDYFDYSKRMFGLLEFEVREVQVVAGTRSVPAREQKDLPDILKDIGAALALS